MIPATLVNKTVSTSSYSRCLRHVIPFHRFHGVVFVRAIYLQIIISRVITKMKIIIMKYLRLEMQMRVSSPRC